MTITKNIRLCLAFCSLTAVLFLPSCKNQPDDSVIRKNISDTMAAYMTMSGVTATVDKGVVSLTGTCDGNDCVDQAEQKILNIDGVKKVVNQVTVSTTDLTLRTSVQSIVSKYQGVTADVAAGEIVLRGSISRDLLEPLMTELSQLNAKKIDNQLAILQ